jgi:TolA-binding protein
MMLSPQSNLPRAVAVAVAFAALAAGRAPAQPYQPAGGRGPVTSPYLNLLRGDNPAYLNYYGLVRPEQQFRNQMQQQQFQLGNVTSAVNGIQQQQQQGQFRNVGVATGHTFGFQTQRTYFMTLGSGGVGGGSGSSFGSTGGGGGGGVNGATIPSGRGSGFPTAAGAGAPVGVGSGRR